MCVTVVSEHVDLGPSLKTPLMVNTRSRRLVDDSALADPDLAAESPMQGGGRPEPSSAGPSRPEPPMVGSDQPPTQQISTDLLLLRMLEEMRAEREAARASQEKMMALLADAITARNTTPSSPSPTVPEVETPPAPPQPILPTPPMPRAQEEVLPGPPPGEPIYRENPVAYVGEEGWETPRSHDQRREDLEYVRGYHRIDRERSPFRPIPRPPPVDDRGIRTRTTRIDFPKFKGGDPVEWLYHAEQFFAFQHTEDDAKVLLASFHLEGSALHWYKSASTNGRLEHWDEFSAAISRRFGAEGYEDFDALLTKLVQRTTVGAYQEEFEKISSRCNPTWPDALLRSSFVSGLRGEIQADVKALRPATLEDAFQYAILMERKHKEMRSHGRTFVAGRDSRYPARPIGTIAGSAAIPRAAGTPQGQRAPLRPSNDVKGGTRPAVRTLTPAQVEERRAKGLCFRCDERYTPGHRCARATGSVMLIDGQEDVEDEVAAVEEEGTEVYPDLDHEEHEEDGIPAEISLHAYSGTAAPKTLRVDGLIKKKCVHILIDSGSTHNFLDQRLVKGLGLEEEPTTMFEVAIGDGTKLRAGSLCRRVGIRVQGHEIFVDLYPLALRGADIVLGTQWLQSLGPVTFDFGDMWMKFRRNGRVIRFDGVRAATTPTLQHMNGLPSSREDVYLLLMSPTAPESAPSSGIKPELIELLTEFSAVFEEPKGLPPKRDSDHRIEIIPGAEPTNVRPYRYPHVQKEEITKMVGEMLSQGIIRPSRSAYSSPVLLVRKKDGGWRFCVDYRALNTITVKDRYPIPVIEELLDELAGAAYFSKLDLRAGYHQIRVDTADVHKTAFRTHDGHYEFLVMPFGLTNAPATFQGLMNDIFRPLLRRYVLVFFDDILVYSRNFDEHLQHLRHVLEILENHSLKVKMSKCLWGVEKVEYLGHVITKEGVSAEPSKISCMLGWPVPRSVRELRGFLGLTGYYRRFIAGYGKIASPLTALLKKDAFVWSDKATAAFEELKSAMTSAPVLALPDFSKAFVIECDASGVGIGAVLMQGGRPIAFMSKALSERSQQLSTYEREMLAILHAVTKWRPYLIGRRFTIRTDQRSLPYFMSQRIHTPAQQRWVTKLLGYDYELQYKKGAENRVADALSRQTDGAELAAFSVPIFPFLEELRGAGMDDPSVKSLMQDLAADPTSHPELENRDGILLDRGRIRVPAVSSLRTRVLDHFHNTPEAGHEGVLRTYKRLSKSCTWPGMRRDVREHVRACETCQRAKVDTLKPAGLLQPLPVPDRVWEDISMDFIEGLPLVRGFSVIFVVVDRLSKYAHFVALAHPFSAKTVAECFVQNVAKLHGMPRTIVSDRDRVFISEFWTEYFRLQGTRLDLSSAYHPQSDGQTEAVNRVLEQYLRCFVGDHPRRWLEYLPWAEWSYNTAEHSSTGMSPFEAVYGRTAPTLRVYDRSASSDRTEVDMALLDRDETLRRLRTHMRTAQVRQKQVYDRGHRDQEYDIGDMVYVRVQPYRQVTLRPVRNQKLSHRFFGPFKVLERIGPVAYRLELPEGTRVHPVFHVSLLRARISTDQIVGAVLPEPEDEIEVVEPVRVLARRRRRHEGRLETEVLVEWLGKPSDEATWELETDIMDRFPDFTP